MSHRDARVASDSWIFASSVICLEPPLILAESTGDCAAMPRTGSKAFWRSQDRLEDWSANRIPCPSFLHTLVTGGSLAKARCCAPWDDKTHTAGRSLHPQEANDFFMHARAPGPARPTGALLGWEPSCSASTHAGLTATCCRGGLCTRLHQMSMKEGLGDTAYRILLQEEGEQDRARLAYAQRAAALSRPVALVSWHEPESAMCHQVQDLSTSVGAGGFRACSHCRAFLSRQRCRAGGYGSHVQQQGALAAADARLHTPRAGSGAQVAGASFSFKAVLAEHKGEHFLCLNITTTAALGDLDLAARQRLVDEAAAHLATDISCDSLYSHRLVLQVMLAQGPGPKVLQVLDSQQKDALADLLREAVGGQLPSRCAGCCDDLACVWAAADAAVCALQAALLGEPAAAGLLPALRSGGDLGGQKA